MPPPPPEVLAAFGIAAPARLAVLKDLPGENASWLARPPGGERVVLRRYHDAATEPDLRYEHAVLARLARAGWTVPEPASDLVARDGRWYCLTRYVPGAPVLAESAAQRTRRGADLARLHAALRGLDGELGQRPGWRAQHDGVTVHNALDWPACLAGLTAVSPQLGQWAAAAAARAGAELAVIGARELPLMVVHGDFAEWNVHYTRHRLAGVIDFGLTHLDSRPYELAIARTYRAPEARLGYLARSAALGWPFSELESAAIEPVYHAFRVDMAAWSMHSGLRDGAFDLAMIERQLARTGTPPP
jgi:Ser/Thr protein kinase RdoA (MazF antagonist)